MNVQFVTTEQQLQDAFTVRKLVFVEEQGVSAEEEYDMYDETAKHVVLYDENTPIGAGRMREVEGVGKLERICVLSSYRGKGAGRLIMDALEELAAAQHLQKVKLHAQTQAEAFYQKLGYQTVSDVFIEADIPHVVMVKSI
ncbi:GNAT family N-acetyltransferase [Ectobacillus antri]|uniref:GNAT family N-acetyltransferase n=1 Tax=Ectobacillus antri TaxID=2486280 RepID=A0ABT6H6L8_9BACI|nr:GNAT family N-acetyltransferase [Ectobacillus antri]MDG4656611.1 GNAT family N-acetyltransferase [Ectobacillus antri]MDG5754026.1 GNAT family N-acetyltransferase [Ectobacillus antri]